MCPVHLVGGRLDGRQAGRIEPVDASGGGPGTQNWFLGAIGALAVLFGVLLMHSAPMPFAAAEGISEHTMTATTITPSNLGGQSSASSTQTMESVSAAHCGNGCTDHVSAMHLCLAIVGAFAALTALRAIVNGVAVTSSRAARIPTARHRPGRPPPWTILTLFELSVLRI